MTELRETPKLSEIYEVLSFAAMNRGNKATAAALDEELGQLQKWIEQNPAQTSAKPAAAP